MSAAPEKDAKISPQTVAHVAKLARLKLSEKEQGELSQVLSHVLAHFEQIAKVNTDGVLPLLTPTDMSQGLRADVAEKLIDSDKLLENAPDKSGRLFKVPPVVG
jgi:aspartyl-tRNA(Asn)/glutamyl-tRNA(Gln) amidotransferase subunit C